MPNVFQALAEHVGISQDVLELQTGYKLLLGQIATGNGASADSIVNLGMIPLAHWRVVGVGMVVSNGGASTVAEKVEWGYNHSDIGSEDMNAFGELSMDVTADKEWSAGDTYIKVEGYDLATPDAEANAGTPTWGDGGDLLGVWQTKPALLTCMKTNVSSSTSTLIPFMLLEV